MRIRKAEGYFGSGQASIPGRLVLDGIDLLRGAFVRMDDYSLDAVAREVLGEGKAVAGDARDRLAEIIHNYKHDLAGVRALRPHRCASRLPDRREAASRRARLRAQPAHRHDAGSGRGQHRLLRFSVPIGARARAHRRSERARQRLARARRAAGRPRARARDGPARATSGCSISRACTRASSAPSTSTP